MAPMVVMKIPPRSNDSTFLRPMKLPRKPPMIAPAMPMSIVTKIPTGSFRASQRCLEPQVLKAPQKRTS
jgi:hypothetical protein